jgi:hypothetical protein
MGARFGVSQTAVALCYGSEFWTDDGSLFTSGHATLVGAGAHEGLVYHQLYGQSPTADLYPIAGWIEPVE